MVITIRGRFPTPSLSDPDRTPLSLILDERLRDIPVSLLPREGTITGRLDFWIVKDGLDWDPCADRRPLSLILADRLKDVAASPSPGEGTITGSLAFEGGV